MGSTAFRLDPQVSGIYAHHLLAVISQRKQPIVGPFKCFNVTGVSARNFSVLTQGSVEKFQGGKCDIFSELQLFAPAVMKII